MLDLTFQTCRVGSTEYEQTLLLRDQVLRKPIGLTLSADDVKHDAEKIHFGAFIRNELIGCVIIQDIGESSFKISQMAIADEHQGKGLGSQLLAYAESECQARGGQKVVLNARQYAAGFYQRSGYVKSSDEFISVGLPHFVMEKRF